jgi:hypothetical protein
MTRHRIIIITAVTIALAAGGTAAYASIPDSGGTIHACYGKDGTLRVIDTNAGQACGKGATTLTWSQNGRQTISVTTATADMQPFGLPGSPSEPYATATCPAGTVVTGGGVKPPPDGQVLATYPTADGTGWFAQEYGGPAGYVGTVYVQCASLSS